MERVNQRTNHLLGTNIRKLRIERNLRNKDVVAQLQLRNVEISTGTYSKVELGFNNPSVDMLIALTDIFHCDYNAFFHNKMHFLLYLFYKRILLIRTCIFSSEICYDCTQRAVNTFLSLI